MKRMRSLGPSTLNLLSVSLVSYSFLKCYPELVQIAEKRKILKCTCGCLIPRRLQENITKQTVSSYLVFPGSTYDDIYMWNTDCSTFGL